MKNHIRCKKSLCYPGTDDIIFREDEYYFFLDDNDPESYCNKHSKFIYYDFTNIDEKKRGYRFYTVYDGNNKISDYFYYNIVSLKEIRKLKLKKLNERS
jgi:hypothetical protein